jgi:SAM-dependent methyltransferase
VQPPVPAPAATAPPADVGGPVLAVLEAEVDRVVARTGRAARVLDVGGGSGAWAVALARRGCPVTVVDTSPDALATLRRRAREAGVAQHVTPVQGDIDAGDAAAALAGVAPPGGADLVLGHGLLEVVDDAAHAVAALAAATAPGGALSLLVAGRHAAVLGRALAGRLGEVRALLTDPQGRTGPDDPLQRRLDGPALLALLHGAGLVAESAGGDGLLGALVPGAVRDAGPGAARTLAELEALAVADPALRAVAGRLHALGRRPA